MNRGINMMMCHRVIPQQRQPWHRRTHTLNSHTQTLDTDMHTNNLWIDHTWSQAHNNLHHRGVLIENHKCYIPPTQSPLSAYYQGSPGLETQSHANTCMHASTQTHKHMHTPTHTRTSAYSLAHTHKHPNTHAHADTHSRKHIHTQI